MNKPLHYYPLHDTYAHHKAETCHCIPSKVVIGELEVFIHNRYNTLEYIEQMKINRTQKN